MIFITHVFDILNKNKYKEIKQSIFALHCYNRWRKQWYSEMIKRVWMCFVWKGIYILIFNTRSKSKYVVHTSSNVRKKYTCKDCSEMTWIIPVWK